MSNKYTVSLENKSLVQCPEMEKPEHYEKYKKNTKRASSNWGIGACIDYDKHLASLLTLPLQSIPEGWVEGQVVTDKEIRLQHQFMEVIAAMSGKGIWLDCGEGYYNTRSAQHRRILAIPILPAQEGKEEKGIESICQICGGHNPVWSAENGFFNKVNGSPNGIICPTCFIEKANKLNVKCFALAPFPPENNSNEGKEEKGEDGFIRKHLNRRTLSIIFRLICNKQVKRNDMKKIPTQQENPTGLHQRYVVQKISEFGNIVPVDKNAEYFIMRLDEGGKDREHIKACRIGIHAYANAIEHHLPELAKDLRKRYPLLP